MQETIALLPNNCDWSVLFKSKNWQNMMEDFKIQLYGQTLFEDKRYEKNMES